MHIGNINVSRNQETSHLCVAICILGSCAAKPTVSVMQGAKRAVRYLKITTEMEMQINPGINNQLSAIVDSSRDADKNPERRRRTGLIIFIEMTWYMLRASCRSTYRWAERRTNSWRCQKHAKRFHGCKNTIGAQRSTETYSNLSR